MLALYNDTIDAIDRVEIMDYLFFGGRGSGKTLGAVLMILIALLEARVTKSKLEIWTNSPMPSYPQIGYEPKYIDSIDIIEEGLSEDIDRNVLKILLIDETHTQADSRTSGSHTNRQLANFATQARKRNFQILYTTQILNGYDYRLRLLTDRVVFCQPIFAEDIGFGTPNYPEPLEFQYYVTIPNENWKLENSFAFSREFARQWLYPLYETDAPIMPIETTIARESK